MTYLTDRAREFSRRSPQLSDSVASYIRDMILMGEARSGEYLRVDRISKDIGVSMTPVREALAALRREGFVDQEPRRGYVVAALNERDVEDIFHQLADISAELAGRAVTAMSAPQFKELSDINDAFEDAALAGMVEDVERLHLEFHRFINTISDSAKLQWILGMLVRYVPRRLFSTIPGWWESSVKEHRSIVDALRRRDEGQVRAAVSAHAHRAGAILVDHLRAKQG